MNYTVFYKMGGSVVFSRDFATEETARAFANLQYKDRRVVSVSLQKVTTNGLHTIAEVEKADGEKRRPGQVVRRGLSYNHATYELEALCLPVATVKRAKWRTGFYDVFGQCLAVYDENKESLVIYGQNKLFTGQEVVDMGVDYFDNQGWSRAQVRDWLLFLRQYGYMEWRSDESIMSLWDVIVG